MFQFLYSFDFFLYSGELLCIVLGPGLGLGFGIRIPDVGNTYHQVLLPFVMIIPSSQLLGIISFTRLENTIPNNQPECNNSQITTK